MVVRCPCSRYRSRSRACLAQEISSLLQQQRRLLPSHPCQIAIKSKCLSMLLYIEISEKRTNLKLRFRRETPFVNVALKPTNRILSATHTLDFVTGTVCSTRIGHSLVRRLVSVVRQYSGEKSRRTSVLHNGK